MFGQALCCCWTSNLETQDECGVRMRATNWEDGIWFWKKDSPWILFCPRAISNFFALRRLCREHTWLNMQLLRLIILLVNCELYIHHIKVYLTMELNQ